MPPPEEKNQLGLDLASKRLRRRRDYNYHLDFRLRWNDNDVFGHMNNPYYGVLIDSIVNQYMIEECGYKVNRDVQAGIIANTYCDYFGSVSYPDVVECGLRVVKLGKASVMYEVGIFRKGDDDVKAVGGSTHVFVNQHDGQLGKPDKKGMPSHMRRGYERLLRNNDKKGAKL
ncbi:uncharacterized protein PV06_10970 [Exophiala oligosperma]|uniref:Thioesterase domain-containing protein n=1 Tax=Exophiala oligosperma TaxID=215243 RepID=A0A0D2D3H9_9EURO|nr:uncharacterized protein PV06_10970 [Exophiala oligosperma]KIW36855.1 hypothetical protein PV06_10970 [Exophiala oligosperma]